MIELAATLRHEREALLRSVAALQLIPENAAKWMRFERLLEVALAATAEEEQHTVSASRLRGLLTSPPIVSAQILSEEDAFDETFTAAIAFYGGTFRVVMGGASGASAGCQLVLEAVRTLTDHRFDNFRSRVMGDANVLLKLSEVMCTRAGLPRWTGASRSPLTPLFLPQESELQRLARCATFTDKDLNDVLGSMAPQVRYLVAPGRLGLVERDEGLPTDDRLYLRPLVDLSGGEVLVALPSGIAASITHNTLARAVVENLVGPVVNALHEANLQAIHRYVYRVRWQQLSRPTALEDPHQLRDVFYWFDIDKVAHVVSVVDPLEGYRTGHPFDSGGFDRIGTELSARFATARAAIRANGATFVLHVIVTAPLGRSSFMGFTEETTDDASELLVLTTDDLDLLTRLEAPEPLGLWRFASAVAHLHDESDVISFSAMDDYATYRDNGYSFYMSDDRRPKSVLITPGSAGDLRIRERQRLDQHAAMLPTGDAVVEVVRWPVDDSTPIYRPNDPELSSLHLVELDVPCWVVPAPESKEESKSSEDLAQSVAFWLWRCRDLLEPALARLTQHGLTIKTRFMCPTLEDQGTSEIEPTSSWFICQPLHHKRTVELMLLEGAALRMVGPGNEAERVIAGALVVAVRDLADMPGGPLPEEIAASLPSGPMRMLHVFGGDDDLFFVFGYTATPRLVSSADVETLLDDVGTIMSTITGLEEGPIATGERTRILNSIVAELFTRLRDRLVGFDPEGLFEHLAAEQEALIYVEARDRLLAPSQAACFGEGSSAVQRAIGSARDLTTTAIANRFLIEFVTAISPSGSKVLSVSDYDELVALASEIIQFGYLSDAIRYDLSSVELAVLPSGRLGVSRDDPYQKAIETYASRVAGRALELGSTVFASHWRDVSIAKEPFNPTELNRAFEAEFGVTATEMAQLSGDLMELARNAERQIAMWPLDDLVAFLEAKESWPAPKVRTAIDLLTLGPLDEFPPPENRAAAYPWRFSRNRSATRRPLLLRERASHLEVLWGPRAVYRSGHYLLNLLHADRLDIQSCQMRDFVTSLRQDCNEQFQHEVAALYSQTTFDVRENVKRIGKLRLIRENGEDIGDIDVLVIEHNEKVLVTVEVKDFEFARTPAELSNEMKKLLYGPKSAAYHHEERLAFLRSKRDLVHAELKLSGSSREWQIHGAIVTSHDLLAAHFPVAQAQAKRLNIVCFDDLFQRSQRGRLVRRTPNSVAKDKHASGS